MEVGERGRQVWGGGSRGGAERGGNQAAGGGVSARGRATRLEDAFPSSGDTTALWFHVEQIQERPTVLFKAILGGKLEPGFGFLFTGPR